MAQRILVPVDGSPLGYKALSVALADYSEAEVTALHVIDPTEPGYSSVSVGIEAYDGPQHGSDEWYDRAEEYAAEVFETAHEQANDHDTELTTETAVGRPDREIVRYIETNDVDHVILGSHGRDRESLTRVGGVAEAIVFRSPVQVTVVK